MKIEDVRHLISSQYFVQHFLQRIVTPLLRLAVAARKRSRAHFLLPEQVRVSVRGVVFLGKPGQGLFGPTNLAPQVFLPRLFRSQPIHVAPDSLRKARSELTQTGFNPENHGPFLSSSHGIIGDCYRVKVFQARQKLRPGFGPLRGIEEVAPVAQEPALEPSRIAEPGQKLLSAVGERPQDEGVAPGDEAVDHVEAVEDHAGPAAQQPLLDVLLLGGDADGDALSGGARLAEERHPGRPLVVPEDKEGAPALPLGQVKPPADGFEV